MIEMTGLPDGNHLSIDDVADMCDALDEWQAAETRMRQKQEKD